MAEKIGKYEVIDQIGRGGMGTILRARDPVLQRTVALKVISNLEVTPELRARFFREAQACARLTHPNIVIIHDMGEDSGRLFIVMELLDGEELRRVIDRQAQLVYPPLALQQRAEGTVELNVLIDERGNVTDAKVVKGTSGMGLNQAAIDNVRRRKYRPATKDGVAVKVYLTVIVKFALPR